MTSNVNREERENSTGLVQPLTGSVHPLVRCMRIRFADISQMLRVADPRSGARLCEAQHVQSVRMPINRIGMVRCYLTGGLPASASFLFRAAFRAALRAGATK